MGQNPTSHRGSTRRMAFATASCAIRKAAVHIRRRPAQALVLHGDRHPAHPLGAIGQPVEGRADAQVVEQWQPQVAGHIPQFESDSPCRGGRPGVPLFFELAAEQQPRLQRTVVDVSRQPSPLGLDRSDCEVALGRCSVRRPGQQTERCPVHKRDSEEPNNQHDQDGDGVHKHDRPGERRESHEHPTGLDGALPEVPPGRHERWRQGDARERSQVDRRERDTPFALDVARDAEDDRQHRQAGREEPGSVPMTRRSTKPNAEGQDRQGPKDGEQCRGGRTTHVERQQGQGRGQRRRQPWCGFMGGDPEHVGAGQPEREDPLCAPQSQKDRCGRDRGIGSGRPVVLSFYRGSWCPYCNLELRTLQAHIGEFEARGARLVAISPQVPDESLSVTEKHDLSFDVLSDVGTTVAQDFGLAFDIPAELAAIYESRGHDLIRTNGGHDRTLVIPASYVVGHDGVVSWAFVNSDYTKRAEPSDMIAALDALR
jgi:peroxiredoxin